MIIKDDNITNTFKIITKINKQSSIYQENLSYTKLNLDKLQNAYNESSTSKKIQTIKHSPTERINMLIDKGSYFFELSKLAGYKMYGSHTKNSGIITGIGIVNSVRCIIICNDFMSKAGTYFPITVKKHLRAQEIAMQHNLPCFYIVDSGGAYLPFQEQVFADENGFGKIFYNQSLMSAAAIPQVAIVVGSCTAGGAYIPAMSDETVMVTDIASAYLAGPPLVKAAIGESTSKELLGGSKMHCEQSGLGDYLAATETEAFTIAREIINHKDTVKIRANNNSFKNRDYSAEEIYGIINKDSRFNYDCHEIIARITDESIFCEYKKNYATSIVCGTATIHGHEVALIANNGVILGEAALKVANFIQICSKNKTAIIFLHNTVGFMVGSKAEQEGIIKNGACMINALATSNCPKITIITGGSYGAGNYAMCGRAFKPNFLWSWPNSKTAIMGGEQAANVLADIKENKMNYEKKWSKNQKQQFCDAINKQFKEESNCIYQSSRLKDDGIIDPKDTRKVLVMALDIISQSDIKNSNHGVFRL